MSGGPAELGSYPGWYPLRLATAVAALAVSQSNVGITDRTQLAAMMARVDLQPFN
jgi:1-phosphofructokinase